MAATTSKSLPVDPSFLQAIPQGLRDELLEAYGAILRNYRERRWEPAELNGGKLCEVVHTILRGHVDGSFPPKANKPANMVDACRALEQASASFPRAVRIQIPRMLIALYEIRNNRGVGHVGGDVDPNHMDAVCVLQMAKWILGELVRLFHSVSTEAAAAAVDAIVDRTLPMVWEVNGKRRVLNPKMKMLPRTLILLYHSSTAVPETELCNWVEHSNPSVYRRDILRPAHKKKLIEFDSDTGMVSLSPLGIEYVETKLLA